jgi:hypothetical protein
MPKEMTHLLVAQCILDQADCFPACLEDALVSNQEALHLGAILPDAFFYNLLPWPPAAKGLPTITTILHRKKPEFNDDMAIMLLKRALVEAPGEALTAFSAGLISHTVSDRMVHDIIDRDKTLWQETGLKALGSHRQIETALDLMALNLLGLSPRQCSINAFMPSTPEQIDDHIEFAVRYLVSPPLSQRQAAAQATRWAYTQHKAIWRLFTCETAYRTARLFRRVSFGRSEFLSGLFYPRNLCNHSLPILKRLDLKQLTGRTKKIGDFEALIKLVVEKTMGRIENVFASVVRSI